MRQSSDTAMVKVWRRKGKKKGVCVFVQIGRDLMPDKEWGGGTQAGGQMVSLMVAEIKEGIRRLQGVHSDGNYSK